MTKSTETQGIETAGSPSTLQADQGEALFAEDIEKSKALAATMNAITSEQLALSEKVGAIKAAGFFKKVATVAEIKMLAEIKKSEKYKGLRILDCEQNWRQVATWEDFCNSLGQSRRNIDEKIQNLSVFGEDFLEASQRMGVGYRDLRRLRALPEADREVVVNGEAIQSEDRESLLDIIEEMVVKNLQDKEKLKKT